MTYFNDAPAGEEADIVILGVPFDLGATTNGGGQADAPRVIRNSYVCPMPPGLTIVDAGDIECDHRSIDTLTEILREETVQLYPNCRTLVVLGGDDSINYGLLHGLRDATDRLPNVDHLDAHSDAQRSPGGRLDHSTWVDLAWHNGISGTINSYGVREPGTESGYIPVFPGDLGADALCVDIDVVDPACAPGVSVPEPGGISSRDLLSYCRAVGKEHGGVSLLSFTELVPSCDINDMTARLVFRCVIEYAYGLAAHMAESGAASSHNT